MFDFGHLVKLAMNPDTISGKRSSFLSQLRNFCCKLYDVKYIAVVKACLTDVQTLDQLAQRLCVSLIHTFII